MAAATSELYAVIEQCLIDSDAEEVLLWSGSTQPFRPEEW